MLLLIGKVCFFSFVIRDFLSTKYIGDQMYKYGKMGENAKKIWAKAAAESKYRKRF